MSRPRARPEPKLRGLKAPPPEPPPPIRRNKILLSLTDEERGVLAAIAAARGGEPIATTARALAVAAARFLLGKSAADRARSRGGPRRPGTPGGHADPYSPSPGTVPALDFAPRRLKIRRKRAKPAKG